MGEVQDNRQALVELQVGYVQRLRGRLETIETQWDRVYQHPSDDANLKALYKEIHQVYGSAASFGLAGISEVLQPLDLYLRNIIETETPLTSDDLDTQRASLQGFKDLVGRLLETASPRPAQAAPVASNGSTTPSAPALRVLVAEDSGLLRRRLVLELSQAGFDVEEVENGLKALTRIQERAPDLALMNVMMPVLDGVQVVRRLREDPRLEHLPVLLLTPPERVEDVEKVARPGNAEYLIKPVHPAQVVAQVQEALGKHAGQDVS